MDLLVSLKEGEFKRKGRGMGQEENEVFITFIIKAVNRRNFLCFEFIPDFIKCISF
jgi:hypothetical protein